MSLSIADQLRKAIRASGHSLPTLARETGVKKDRLRDFVRDEKTLTLSEVDKLCRYLGVMLRTVYTKATPTDVKVLRDQGKSHSAVAEMLGISRRTVFRYAKRIS